MHDFPYALTNHARRVIAEREISMEWIARIISNPQKTESDPENAELVHALGRIAERSEKVLRVIYNKTATPPRIVTAYFDRTQKGKL